MLVKATDNFKALKGLRASASYDLSFEVVKTLRNGETVEVGEASGNLMLQDNMVEEIKQAEPEAEIKEPDYGS